MYQVGVFSREFSTKILCVFFASLIITTFADHRSFLYLTTLTTLCNACVRPILNNEIPSTFLALHACVYRLCYGFSILPHKAEIPNTTWRKWLFIEHRYDKINLQWIYLINCIITIDNIATSLHAQLLERRNWPATSWPLLSRWQPKQNSEGGVIKALKIVPGGCCAFIF